MKNLSNKLERCYNSKVTFEHMLKTQRNYGDKCGLGFKKKMTKGERKRERKMKKLQQRKLSHTCATGVIKRDTLQMVVLTLRSSRR